MWLQGDAGRVVFLCHGLGGSGQGNTARAVTPALLAEGIGVCRFDFSARTLAGAVDELRRIVDTVAPQRFGLFGSSFGGAVATLFAAERTPAGLFLKSPLVDLRALCRTLLGAGGLARWEREGTVSFPTEAGPVELPWGFYADAPDVAAAAARVRAPIAIVHGDADRTVPLEDSRRLPGTLHVLPGVGHRFPEPGALERVARLAAEFFRVELRP